MTSNATKSRGALRAQQAKQRARQARLQRSTGAELGFKPAFGTGRWQRERPTQRGVYCIVSREGGLWTGAIAVPSQDHRGWWWSEPVAAGQPLHRLPPAPSWDGDDSPAQDAPTTGADARPEKEQ